MCISCLLFPKYKCVTHQIPTWKLDLVNFKKGNFYLFSLISTEFYLPVCYNNWWTSFLTYILYSLLIFYNFLLFLTIFFIYLLLKLGPVETKGYFSKNFNQLQKTLTSYSIHGPDLAWKSFKFKSRSRRIIHASLVTIGQVIA